MYKNIYKIKFKKKKSALWNLRWPWGEVPLLTDLIKLLRGRLTTSASLG